MTGKQNIIRVGARGENTEFMEVVMGITKLQIEELRELYNKSTSGKWHIGECIDGVYHGKKCLVKSDGKEIVGVRQIGRPQHNDRIEENAALIVAMQNMLPDILDVLE